MIFKSSTKAESLALADPRTACFHARRTLGLVEAKRTKRDARIGQQQAKLYADCQYQ